MYHALGCRVYRHVRPPKNCQLSIWAKLSTVIASKSFRGLLLPCLALAIPMCSRFIRQFRVEILEQLGKSYNGAVREENTTENLLRAPRDAYTRELLDAVLELRKP